MRWSAALLVVAILGIGMTVAYFTDIEAAVNSITTGKIEIETNENVEDLTKRGIGVASAGKSKCYVRMRVDIPNVEYAIGGETKKAEIKVPNGNGDELTIDNWNAVSQIDTTVQSGGKTAKWVKMEDGFWYLSAPLDPGESAVLISSITYPGLWENGKLLDPMPDGLTADMLTIPITSEAVQADNIEVSPAEGADAAKLAFDIVSGIKDKQ